MIVLICQLYSLSYRVRMLVMLCCEVDDNEGV